MGKLNPLYFKADFHSGGRLLTDLPQDSEAEVAFAGRSNAGKSSAINAITRNNKLARISKTPGRTQEINYFSLSNNHYLVDLPGYGFAKVPKAVREHWNKTLPRYFAETEALKGLILLMDIRHPLTDLDGQMIGWVIENDVPLHCLLTKADKLSKNAANKSLQKVLKELENEGVEASLQLFSSTKNVGIEDCHSVLNDWLN